MAINAFVLWCFAWLAKSLSARVTTGQEEMLPWKKAFTFGTVLGRTHCANAVVGKEKKDPGAFTHLDADFYENAESFLITLLQDHLLDDNAVVEKFIRNLRRSKIFDDDILESLDASFRGRLGKPPRIVVAVQGESKQNAVQQMFFPVGEGEEGVIITHYLKHYRETEDETTLLDMLRSFEISGSFEDGLFLRCIAQSHTSEELAKDLDTDFLVMVEPSSGTLDAIIQNNDVDYHRRVLLFLDLFAIVRRLHDLNIPHVSDIGPQTIFVKGDVADVVSPTVVLSPELSVQSSTMSASDLFKADIQQLGKLLRWLFNSNCPADMRQRNDVVLAFAKAMESGALPCARSTTKELSAVFQLVLTEDSTDDDLLATRMNYLQQAMRAVRLTETSPERALA